MLIVSTRQAYARIPWDGRAPYNGEEGRLPIFRIVQAEAELEVRFQPRLWTLIHDVPRLYEALLVRLADSGLSASDLRPGGSGATSSLSFWLFNYNVDVTLRLEGFSVKCNQIKQGTRDQVAKAVEAVMVAIQDVSGQSFSSPGCTISYSAHGEVLGSSGQPLIGRFVQATPEVIGFGPSSGAGAAFYYGEALPLLSSALTVDASRVVPNGIFVRVVLVMGPLTSILEHIGTAIARVESALSSLDLQGEAGAWS